MDWQCVTTGDCSRSRWLQIKANAASLCLPSCACKHDKLKVPASAADLPHLPLHHEVHMLTRLLWVA